MRWITIVALGLVFTPLGCEDDDTGVPCERDVTRPETTSAGPLDGQVDQPADKVGISSQALSCRSRLCIRPSSQAPALCTHSCATADDCPDATETCASGYACVIGQSLGVLACCKLCVCKDHLSFDPRADPQRVSCEGKAPVCPEP